MANMWKIIALFLVFQEPAFVSSHLVLNKVLGLTVSAMECLSEKDITFFFTSKDTNIKVTVAECDRSIKSCYLLDQSMGELYSVSFIGGGGQFLILEDNSNTWGQYICCETHNNTSCQSTEISSTIIRSTDANTDRNSNSHLGEKHSIVINSTVIKETTVINQTVIKETSNNVDVIIPLLAALVPLAALGIVAIVVFGLVLFFKERPCLGRGNNRSNKDQTKEEKGETVHMLNKEAKSRGIETENTRVIYRLVGCCLNKTFEQDVPRERINFQSNDTIKASTAGVSSVKAIAPQEYEELANKIHELQTPLQDTEQELTDIQSTPPKSPEKEPELPPPVPHLPHGAHGTHIGTNGTHVGNGTKPEPVVGASGPAGVPESTLLSSPSLPMKSPLMHVKEFLPNNQHTSMPNVHVVDGFISLKRKPKSPQPVSEDAEANSKTVDETKL